jgi:phosphatidylglycerophosphate synthase
MTGTDRFQAALTTAAILASLAFGRAELLALGGVVAFCVRIVVDAASWRSAGGFGVANGVTMVRVAMIAALVLLPSDSVVPWAGLVVASTFALDGLDGWIARVTGTTSAFGAQLDQEADAFTVASATVLAHLHGLVGVWFAIPGLLRYAYVGLVWVIGPPTEAPRSRWGRWAYSLFVVGLVGVLVWPTLATRSFAALATGVLVVSFGRSMWWVVQSARRTSPR